jgi:hypothetical protein
MYTIKTLKHRLGTPKTTRSKYGYFIIILHINTKIRY